MREQFEQDQADAAAIAAAEVEAEFARIAAAADAEARVSELRAWIERLTGTVEAYRRRRGRGRAVELLADVLARAAVVRTSGRGRPSALGVVAAVMAVDADFKSGRRARPGRERTAWLAGVSSRAVYSSWGQGQALGAWVRTCRGGRNNQARRIETGRFNDRAEFDFAPLHRGDSVARAGYVPAALGVLDGLLTHAEGLLRQAQAELDALAGSDFTALARRAAMRRAVARAHDTVTATLAALDTANSCHTHTVSKGECVSSWLYWGYSYSPEHMINSNDRQGRPPSDREEDGASRSPTRATQGDLEGSRSTRGRCSSPRRVERPRTLQTACGRPRRGRGPRPEWAQWAPVLARDLRELWPWLDRERSAAVAAVLGAALGPDWTAEELARHAGQCGWVLLDEPPRSPLGYLKTLLTAVLTGDQQPPHPARRAIEHRRAQVVAERAERAADRWCGRCDRHRRVEVNHHDRTVPCPRCSPAAAGSTAWPEVRQPGSGLPRTPDDARRGS